MQHGDKKCRKECLIGIISQNSPNVFWRSAMADCQWNSCSWYGRELRKRAICPKHSQHAKMAQQNPQHWFCVRQVKRCKEISMGWLRCAKRQSLREELSCFLNWGTSGSLARTTSQPQKRIRGNDFLSSQLWLEIDKEKANESSQKMKKVQCSLKSMLCHYPSHSVKVTKN